MQDYADYFQNSLSFWKVLAVLGNILSCTNAETHCLKFCNRVPNKEGNQRKSVNPNSNKITPKIIIKCSRIFQPENENVAHN
jgi:hypothetical protein